jgi:ABC-type spermidine/putrescine transport system permease subunit II
MSKRKYDDDYLTKEAIRFYLETQKPAEPFDEHGNLDPSKLDRFTPYSKNVKSYFDEQAKYVSGIYMSFFIAFGTITIWPVIGVIASIVFYILCLMNSPKKPLKTILVASIILGLIMGIIFLFYLITGTPWPYQGSYSE